MQAKMMFLAVFLLSLLAVTPAQSQSVDPQCIDEVERHCGQIEPGFLRIQKCFEANIDKFSPMCQQQLSEGKADAAAGIAKSRQSKEPSMADAKADAITLTQDAIVELTDTPGLGKRATADPKKRWGSDVSVIQSATAKLEQALSQPGGNERSRQLLQLAVDYGKSGEHKEARLAAQGALLNLCKAANKTDAPCDTVPKYGSYVAP
ncbi:MAG: conserved exported protein of unknown function [Nitrospira sp.]